jgi:hypothetical protein
MQLTSPSATAARRPGAPFGSVRPAVIVAGIYLVAAGLWASGLAGLPGGRWLAVHLFTLGVLSNLVMALTVHFAETMLHQPGGGQSRLRMALFNAGVLAVLVGVVTGERIVLAAGATVATAGVFAVYRQLRRIRKTALSQRFGFLVRAYERACGAFLHGALLGALLGIGVLPGTWFAGVRLAHLHTNILGWGGLTLLSTLVVFGPTVLRTRMTADADALAARWLPRAATGLTVAVLALVLTGAGGEVGVALRLLAAAGLAVYATGATIICSSVLRAAAATSHRSVNAVMLSAVCVWLPVTAAADVVAVATGRWWLLNTLGVVVLVGVLGQAIVAAVGYVGPLLRSRPHARPVMRARMDRLAVTRATVLNAGVLLLALAVVTPVPAAAGGALIAAVVVSQAVALLWPVAREGGVGI